MSKIDIIYNLLSSLEPHLLKIIDQSTSHADHYKQEEASPFPSHIKIEIVSPKFHGLSLVARQRLINCLLKDAYENGLHAASIEARSIEEYEDAGAPNKINRY